MKTITLIIFIILPFSTATAFAEEQASHFKFNNMVFVKGGCFRMGDIFREIPSSEKPVHEVCVDDFHVSKYEVTVG